MRIDKDFLGATYLESRDRSRLFRQLDAVKALMQSDYDWHTLEEISVVTQAPQASVSARLRDLRRERHGGHTILRQYAGNGLFRYRMAREGNVEAEA